MTRWVAFVSVGVGASQCILLSVLARNPHKVLAREISHDTGRRRGKEGPRDCWQDRTASKRDQKRAVDRTGQPRDESRAERRLVNRSQKGGC